MTANVEPEEAEAIRSALESDAPASSSVEERDFHRPRRFSPGRNEVVRARIGLALPYAENALKELLSVEHPLAVTSAVEVQAEGLFGALDEFPAGVRFLVDGQIAWAFWDIVPALTVIEGVLGSANTDPEPRELSRVEARILSKIFEAIARPVAAAFGLEAERFESVLGADSIGSWRDAGQDPDPHRLEVDVSITTAGGDSTVRLYLPGVREADVAAESAPPLPTGNPPRHLAHVEFDLSVHFRPSDVPLADLLELEVGDVVPIDAGIGEDVHVTVDDFDLGRAQFGRRGATVVARLTDLDTTNVRDSETETHDE